MHAHVDAVARHGHRLNLLQPIILSLRDRAAVLLAVQQPVRNDSRMTLVSANTRIFGIRCSPHSSNGAVRSY